MRIKTCRQKTALLLAKAGIHHTAIPKKTKPG